MYSDDSYGLNEFDNFTFYLPYSKLLPTKQFLLLSLWDDIGLPHKERKQLSGPVLPIIGIEVDPVRLTYTLSRNARKDLIDELLRFCRRRSNKAGRRTGSSSYPLKKMAAPRGLAQLELQRFSLTSTGPL